MRHISVDPPPFFHRGPSPLTRLAFFGLDFAKELSPDTAQFFPLMVYPGTAAYDWAEKEGLLETNDYDRWLTPV